MPNIINNSISTSVEDYLKAIWTVAKDGSASTNDLAGQLGVAAPSVSGMLAKLQHLGFADYKPYKGVRLTDKGMAQALHLLRRHRLIETFLLEHLGYGWGEVHDEAESLEHAVSGLFTNRLDAFLGYPSHDPHGDPIPDERGSLPNTPNTPLAEINIGENLKVSRLLTQATDALTYLTDLGIAPGAELSLQKREPIGGLLHIAIVGRKGGPSGEEGSSVGEVLSKELAMLVRGEVVKDVQI